MARSLLVLLAVVTQLCCGAWRGQVVALSDADHHGASAGSIPAVAAHAHHDHHDDHAHPHVHTHGGAAPVDGHHDHRDGPHHVPDHDHAHIEAIDACASRTDAVLDGAAGAAMWAIAGAPARWVTTVRSDRPIVQPGPDPGGGRCPHGLIVVKTTRLQV